MNSNRTRSARTARAARAAERDVYERLSQRLEEFLAREREANPAEWALIEDAKIERARLAIFGRAPK
jgi:hypothetical protein